MSKAKLKMFTPRFRTIVRDAIEKYRDELCVRDYDISSTYHSHDEEGSDGQQPPSMAIKVNRRYVRANINIYPAALRDWKELGDESLRRTVAHEIAHIETQHIYEIALASFKDPGELTDAWERLTQIIGRYAYAAVERRRK